MYTASVHEALCAASIILIDGSPIAQFSYGALPHDRNVNGAVVFVCLSGTNNTVGMVIPEQRLVFDDQAIAEFHYLIPTPISEREVDLEHVTPGDVTMMIQILIARPLNADHLKQMYDGSLVRTDLRTAIRAVAF